MSDEELKSLYAVPQKLHRSSVLSAAATAAAAAGGLPPPGVIPARGSGGLGGDATAPGAYAAVGLLEAKFTDDYASIDDLLPEPIAVASSAAAGGQGPNDPARMQSVPLTPGPSTRGDPLASNFMVYPHRVRRPRGPRPIPARFLQAVGPRP